MRSIARKLPAGLASVASYRKQQMRKIDICASHKAKNVQTSASQKFHTFMSGVFRGTRKMRAPHLTFEMWG